MSTSEPAAALPPLGSSVDFNQQSDLWPSLIAVSVISLVIMTVSLSVKVYAKVIKSRAISLEECEFRGISRTEFFSDITRLEHLCSGTLDSDKWNCTTAHKISS